jgi:hypothetical protein
MFRASTDGGQIFNDKINLSNSSDVDSTDAAISAEGGSITVSWWETNETSQEPLIRTSEDFGATFGPIMNLATNGTIGEAEEGAEEEGESILKYYFFFANYLFLYCVEERLSQS